MSRSRTKSFGNLNVIKLKASDLVKSSRDLGLGEVSKALFSAFFLKPKLIVCFLAYFTQVS